MLCLWVQYPLLHSCCHRLPLSTSGLSVSLLPSTTTHPYTLSPPTPSTSVRGAPVKPAAGRDPPSPVGKRLSRRAELWIQLKEKQADQGQEILEEKKVMYDSVNKPHEPSPHPHQPCPHPCFYISLFSHSFTAPSEFPPVQFGLPLLFGLTGFRCSTKQTSIPYERLFTEGYGLSLWPLGVKLGLTGDRLRLVKKRKKPSSTESPKHDEQKTRGAKVKAYCNSIPGVLLLMLHRSAMSLLEGYLWIVSTVCNKIYLWLFIYWLIGYNKPINY